MWLRYPLAAAAGYAVFLILVWCLVRAYRAGADRVLANENEALARGEPVRLDLPDGPDPSGCIDIPGDEGCAVVAAIGVVLCLLVVAFYYVFTAPALFAELVLDSFLVGGLYRRLRGEEEGHWFLSALRRTVGPALIVLAFLAVAGVAFSNYAPDAKSIGAVFAKWRAAH